MGGMDDDACLVATCAHRLLGRTDAVPCFDVEKVLDCLVLEGVKGDDPQPATWLQVLDDLLQPASQGSNLVVDLDAQGLEGLGRRVDAPWPASSGVDSTD